MRGCSVPLLVLVAALTATVHAHIAPVDPSVCTWEPLELTSSAQERVTVTPDAFRIVYSTSTSRATFCLADPAAPRAACVAAPIPRAFVLAGSEGTIAFPASFPGTLSERGDLVTPSLPLVVTLAGVPASAPAVLTTGLAVVGDRTIEGSPIGPDGRLALVAAVPVPPPLGPLALRLTCLVDPPPDLDQFRAAGVLKGVSGVVTRERLALRAMLELPAGQAAVDPATALVRVSAGETVIATAGATELRLDPRRGGRAYRIRMTVPAPTMPPVVGRQAELLMTADVGGVLARANRTFRKNRSGSRLRAAP